VPVRSLETQAPGAVTVMTLAIFLLCVVLVAALSGRFSGGEWYQLMQQPGWRPPALAMAAAWSLYYLSMALTAWLVWERRHRRAVRALSIWLLLLALNVLWAWFFFGLHRVGWSLAVLGLWLAATLAASWLLRPVQTDAARLLLLAGLWLLFVLALNFSQWTLNGGGLASALQLP